MASENGQLVKKARMLRHSQRNVPNILKARFSPIRPTTTDPLAPTTTPAAASNPPAQTVTSATPNPVPPVATTQPVVPPSATLVTPPVLTTSPSAIAITPSTTLTIVSTTSTIPTTTSLLTPTTTPLITTSSSQTTAIVTRTLSTSAHDIASSAASATATSTSSSGISTAGIIGIAGAGIVGAAVLAGLAMFFMRRMNRKEDEFNPHEFRRQSVVLKDDNASLHRGSSNGHGPRPPTMFERHHQNITAFGVPPPNGYQPPMRSYSAPNAYNDLSAVQPPPSFVPGMYMPSSTASQAPPAQYANVSPFYNPSIQSPVGSPATVTSYGGAAFDAQGDGVVRAPSNAAASMLSRNNSLQQSQYRAESDYADLTRASVTPFQAAQYEAISRQLNIPPPKPLHQVTEAEEEEEARRAVRDSLPLPFPDEPTARPSTEASPFADPHVGSSVQDTNHAAADEDDGQVNSTIPSMLVPGATPSPRITSQPPSLPEIRMMSGSFSPVAYSFPVTPSPRKGSFDIHSGRASPKVDLPPLSPVTTSPRRAQFVEGLEARAHDGHETPVEIDFVADDKSSAKTEAKPESAKMNASPKRPETVYDDEDAYGGI